MSTTCCIFAHFRNVQVFCYLVLLPIRIAIFTISNNEYEIGTQLPIRRTDGPQSRRNQNLRLATTSNLQSGL